MATSILMASNHNTKLTLSEDHSHHGHNHNLQTTTTTTRRDYQTARQSSTTTTRRKPSRGNESKKKQPQRGMGVAQLERLRLGERWKKMTEINNNNVIDPSTPPSLPYAFIPTSFAHDPTSSSTVPLHLAKFGCFGTTVNGVGLNFNQQQLLVQRVGLFHGKGNLYGVGNGNETTKELSSTPNVIKCYADHCSVCHQKKRNVTGENLVFKGLVKDMNAEKPSMTSSDFVGLNFGNSQSNKGTNQDFGKKASFHASTYSVGNTNQGVDVVAVHRKGSSSGGGSGNFLEYQFFPAGKGGRSDSFESQNEFMMMMKQVAGSESSSSIAAVMGGGGEAASCVTTTTNIITGGGGVVDASNSIDLSLRLSY